MIKTYYIEAEPVPSHPIDHTWIARHLNIKGDALIAQKVVSENQTLPQLRFVLNHVDMGKTEALLRYWRLVHLMAIPLESHVVGRDLTLMWENETISTSSLSFVPGSALFVLDLLLFIQNKVLFFPDKHVVGVVYEFVSTIMHAYQMDTACIHALGNTYTND